MPLENAVDQIIYGASIGKRREIVVTLYKGGPMTLAKLRDHLNMSPSTLLFELSALEALGVVKREDGLVRLTEIGEKAASIILTSEPLKELGLLHSIGLRPLVVWFLMSPHMNASALVLFATWLVALLLGALINPPLALVGVVYVGAFLHPVKLGVFSLPVSYTSVAVILTLIYILTGRKITPQKALVGLMPLALYPTVHLALYQLSETLGTYLLLASQVLLFISMLLTASMFASVYSFEAGKPFEQSLVRSLLVFFIAPSLVYLIPR